jgi:AraC-like DNA-binding protein
MLLAGECWLDVPDVDQRVALSTGDLVILPRGHAHQLRDNLNRPVRALEEILASQAAPDKWHMYYGGGGARTELLCGGFVIEDRDALPALAALPPIIYVQSQRGRPPEWLEAVLKLLRQELTSRHLGSEAVVTKLTDLLLAEAIRRYRPGLDGVHLLGAATLRDERIASALRLMHEQPQYAWTAVELAERVNMSRSGFSTRFRLITGQPPMRYMTRYRLTRVANRLRTSGESLVDMALQHGYASDVGLSKAFKRYFGMSPGAYRDAIRDVSATALSASLLHGMTADSGI